jgi:subtilisin
MSYGSSSPSTTVQTMMQACYNAGIVLVAAAGNEGNEDNYISYPGGYSTVISVASVNATANCRISPNGVKEEPISLLPAVYCLNIYLPNILSTTYCLSLYYKNYYSTTFSNTYYDGMQGTSMACPIVAGLCGLMLSKDSTLPLLKSKPVCKKRQPLLTAPQLIPLTEMALSMLMPL